MSGEGGSYVGRHGDGASEVVTDDLLAAAREWIDDDPDPQTRGELHQLVDLSERGGPVAAAARAEIADRFSGMLEFGTAGLRGTIGAGPRRMNRAVVIRAAAGLVAHLREASDSPFVVIGRDARHNSDAFALDTAAVVVAAGGRAAVLPEPQNTSLQLASAPSCVLTYSCASWVRWVECAPVALSSVWVLAYSGSTSSSIRRSTLLSGLPEAT